MKADNIWPLWLRRKRHVRKALVPTWLVLCVHNLRGSKASASANDFSYDADLHKSSECALAPVIAYGPPVYIETFALDSRSMP